MIYDQDSGPGGLAHGGLFGNAGVCHTRFDMKSRNRSPGQCR